MTTPRRMERYRRSAELLERARAVIPTGVWGHNRYPAFLGEGSYPYFAREARGAHFTDVDGNEYTDYICGYGAMINGFANREIDAAARERTDLGDCLDQPTEVSVELAETLCSQVEDVAWCGFGKNGSDAVTTAVLIARAHTGRSKVVCVNGAYHGSHFWCNWCNPGEGRPAADSNMVITIDWNAPEQLSRAVGDNAGQIAAVVMTPFHHPIAAAAEPPAEGYWSSVVETCREAGVLIIVDDVRAGFRLDLAGSHVFYDFTPDLVCLSKALANTHPLSAVLGSEATRGAAESVFSAGTYWSCSAPMAAALENLRLLRSDDRFPRMWALGERLCEGLVDAGGRHGVPVEVSGPATIPTVTIAGDDEFTLMSEFAERMVERGSFVHPSHNWFLSAAHTSEDIETTLRHADEVLAEVAGLR